MTRRPPVPFERALLTSLAASLSVWVSIYAWRPLSETSDHLTPLLFSAVVFAFSSAVARWRGLPVLVVAFLHVVTAGLLVLWWTSGSVVPSPDHLVLVRDAFVAAVESSGRYATPVPSDVPPVTPLFFLVAVVSMVVVDLLALSHRKVALTGLVFFVLQVVPVNLGVEVSWIAFALVATGYLSLLFLHHDDLVTRWGHEVSDPAQWGGSPGVGAGRSSAGRIGAFSVAGAVLLSLLLSSLVPGTGTRFTPQRQNSGNEVTLTSPLVDLRRDLVRGADVPLLRVEGPRRPSYVRTAVLSSFNGQEWSSGSRRAARVQSADGTELELPGVSPFLEQDRTRYQFEATRLFRSRWLPVMPLTAEVSADGDWRYDLDTMDFASFGEDLDTAGKSWSLTGVELEYDLDALDDARDGDGQVADDFLDLPRGLPPIVADLAEEVTADESSKYRRARALQSWFRSEFDYSLERATSVGNDELVVFLDESGRVGYCEQFAAAMAVMARTLDIPSRVAVGFLQPRRMGEDRWEFSAHDLHAWPELYFPGSGWVRFEPTPASRASGVPEHSEDDFAPEEETPVPEEPLPTEEPSAAPEAPAPTQAPSAEAEPSDATSFAWGRWLLAALAGALLVLAGMLPRAVRSRIRRRRTETGEVEELWAELRGTAIDLGLPWPEGKSPRMVGGQVEGWTENRAENWAENWADGGDQPSPGAEEKGPAAQPGDVAVATQRLVRAVELNRFGPTTQSAPPELAEDLRTCVGALESAATPRVRRRARWLPRSLAPGRRNSGPN